MILLPRERTGATQTRSGFSRSTNHGASFETLRLARKKRGGALREPTIRAVADSKRALLGGRDAPRDTHHPRGPRAVVPARAERSARARRRSTSARVSREGERPPPHARSAPRASLFPPRARARGGSRRRLAFESRARRERQALEGGPSRVAMGFLSKIYERKGKGQRRGSIAGLLGKPAAGAGAPSSPAEAPPPPRAAPRRGARRGAASEKTTAGDADVPGEDAPRHAPPAPARARPPRPPAPSPTRSTSTPPRTRAWARRRTPRSPRAPRRDPPRPSPRAARADADPPSDSEPHPGGPSGASSARNRPEPRSAPRETRPEADPRAPPPPRRARPAPPPTPTDASPHRIPAPTPSKRRRVTFAEVDAYDMAEEDEDAEEPPESPASAPARWGVFGSPGDAEPSDGDRSAGPSAASLGGANAAEASAPSPEWAKRTRVVPNEDASGRGGGGSPMSPDYAGNHPRGPRGVPRRGDDGEPAASRRRARADEAEPEGAAEGFEAFDALDGGGGGGGGSSGGGRPLRLRDGNARRLDAAARLAVADEAQYALSGTGDRLPVASRLGSAAQLVAVAADPAKRRALAAQGLVPAVLAASLRLATSDPSSANGAARPRAGVIETAPARRRRRRRGRGRLGGWRRRRFCTSRSSTRTRATRQRQRRRSARRIERATSRPRSRVCSRPSPSRPRRTARRRFEGRRRRRGASRLGWRTSPSAARSPRFAARFAGWKFLPHEAADAQTLALLAAHRAVATRERSAAAATARDARRRARREEAREAERGRRRREEEEEEEEEEGREAFGGRRRSGREEEAEEEEEEDSAAVRGGAISRRASPRAARWPPSRGSRTPPRGNSRARRRVLLQARG